MRVKVSKIAKGSHPSEMIVTVDAVTGAEQLVVHERSIENNSLDIGFPINREDSNLLVELPRETVNGAWRIWVPEALVN